MLRTCYLLMALFFAQILSAQQDIGLNFMSSLRQNVRTNPAHMAEHKFTVELPGIRNNLFFTGPTYGDFIVKSNGNTVFDVNSLIDNLETRNLVRENLEINTLGATLRMGKLQFSLNHAFHFNAYLDYPRNFPELIWRGNAQFVGQTIDLGHDLHLLSYSELAAGVAVKLGKIQLGGRVKYLSGIGDVSTQRNSLSLYTDPEFYALTVNADYRINSAAGVDFESFDEFEFNSGFGSFNASNIFNENSGLAFDLGAQAELGKFILAAGIIDLGGIRWKDQVNNYTLNGSFTFEGLDLGEALIGSDSSNLQSSVDTLLAIFTPTRTSETYRTQLPARMYLSGRYLVNDTWSLGAMAFLERYRERSYTAFALNAQARLTNWIELGASYAVVQKSYFNLGLSAGLNLGPVQLFALTDNVFAFITPKESRFFNARAGANLVFGRIDKD